MMLISWNDFLIDNIDEFLLLIIFILYLYIIYTSIWFYLPLQNNDCTNTQKHLGCTLLGSCPV